MRLTITPASPFARKVRMAVIELGLEDRVELESLTLMENPDQIRAANPLGKVPGLVLDDGVVLFDSPLLCEYLESLVDDRRLVPSQGEARWRVLRNQALADGLMDAAVATYLQSIQPDAPPSLFWCERWDAAINGALQELSNSVAGFGPQFELDQIATVCALDYLSLRQPDRDWRSSYPVLSIWLNDIGVVESVQKTKPPQS